MFVCGQRRLLHSLLESPSSLAHLTKSIPEDPQRIWLDIGFRQLHMELGQFRTNPLKPGYCRGSRIRVAQFSFAHGGRSVLIHASQLSPNTRTYFPSRWVMMEHQVAR